MGVTIQINGQKQWVEEGATVTRLLMDLGIYEERVAVELNLKIVEKQDYGRTLLREGDKVEIIRFVGGGSTLLTTE